MYFLYYLLIIISAVMFCEFLGDYAVMHSCKWPIIKEETFSNSRLHIMILADTHLLGPIHGHWLDKLYREWHMKRAFQASLFLHKPNVVFVLGDLFDEGDMVDQLRFTEHVTRFRRHFQTSSDVPVISAVGNHDIGFHYKMHWFFTDRFENNFNNTKVNLYSIKGNHFVFINSMAMENDGCDFCNITTQQLHSVSARLQCYKNSSNCLNQTNVEKLPEYSRPIVLQHFPTYRKSDRSCREKDAPSIQTYRENWEVLSKNSSDLIGKLLHPRLSFAGHTHHYCISINRWGVEEYTSASFSWRNKKNPSFLMLSLNPSQHAVFKCNMLEQQTVYNVYLFTLLVCIISLAWDIFKWTLITTNKKQK